MKNQTANMGDKTGFVKPGHKKMNHNDLDCYIPLRLGCSHT